VCVCVCVCVCVVYLHGSFAKEKRRRAGPPRTWRT